MEFTQKTSDRGISIKRVFVSATPENMVYIHKPGYLWNLPIQIIMLVMIKLISMN